MDAWFQKMVWAFRCLRCGYEWLPRKPWDGDDPPPPDARPRVCPNPKCKSPYWDRHRKSDTPKPSRRVDVRSILLDPVKRRELMVRSLMAIQHREGIMTTREQAEQAYDRVQQELRELDPVED